uniref:G_PROTEIN_RECEP_F1_2 domain-containing protein n=1 Tax=Mesocestoides corti TaxID=53468 RepID=A0A5K3FE73_MESCO
MSISYTSCRGNDSISVFLKNEVREVCNLLIVFSYPCNFVIYFAMSKQFRINFASLVSGWYKRRKKELIETDIS